MNAKAKGTRNEHRSMRLLELAGFPAPANARKVVHRWRDGVRVPDVFEVAA